MAFDPKKDYTIERSIVRLKDFHDYPEAYVTRPPYQRKSVWKTSKKQSLMDSIIRRYYVPDLVFRQVRLSDEKTVDEVIDGQQRITAIQEFFNDKFSLPKSADSFLKKISGKKYSQLDVEVKQFFGQLEIQADRILGIDQKNNSSHQIVATEIFWRLQQGESLNEMEKAHARLSSLVRNFLTRYADDIGFDFERYIPLNENPKKHRFFDFLNRENDRMQHLSILARMLLIEINGGYAELKDSSIQKLIEDTQREDGIGDFSYETEIHARETLATLNLFERIFLLDTSVSLGGKMRQFSVEYFIISMFALLRHLRKYYVTDTKFEEHFLHFIYDFHDRWKGEKVDDLEIASFSNHRQQGESELMERDIIIRHAFFDFSLRNGYDVLVKDEKRTYSEAQRIEIYQKGKGLCQKCIEEGKPEKEARVPWGKYQADHVLPWSKGGKTIVENGQLLCSHHNQSKGANI